MILEFDLGLSFVAAEAFDPGIVVEAFSSDFVPEALAVDIIPDAVVPEAFVPDVFPEFLVSEAATSVTVTITPAPMSVSPVTASRIYPLTVHLFWAARLTAKMTVIAANVIFRIKEYLFEDSLASNPFHYNQSTLSPSSIHTKMQLTQALLHLYTYFPVLLFKTANIYISVITKSSAKGDISGEEIFIRG